MTDTTRPLAPPLIVERWFNTDQPLTLESLRGRIVVLHAFQMLCPGCVSTAIPQARKLNEIAKSIDGLLVLGLHTVFEHHAAMQPVSLQAFLREFGVTHPVGIDASLPGQRVPATMQTYAMQGTPTLILIDRIGCIRLCHFGRMDDLALGAEVMRLLCESG